MKESVDMESSFEQASRSLAEISADPKVEPKERIRAAQVLAGYMNSYFQYHFIQNVAHHITKEDAAKHAGLLAKFLERD